MRSNPSRNLDRGAAGPVSAELVGKVTSLAAGAWLDDDDVPFFAFAMPTPSEGGDATALLSIDLSATGAEVMISLVVKAYDCGAPLRVGLSEIAAMRVAWVELQKPAAPRKRSRTAAGEHRSAKKLRLVDMRKTPSPGELAAGNGICADV